MIELVTSPYVIALIAVIVSIAAIAIAFVVTTRATRRATLAERRLAEFYTEVERAAGPSMNRSGSESRRDQVLNWIKLRGGNQTSANPDNARKDYVALAIKALDAASRAIASLDNNGESAKIVADLGLKTRIATSKATLAELSSNQLKSALMSGALNDLLTTASLIAGYFGRNSDLIPIVEAYGLASTAIRNGLAESGVALEIPASLTIVSNAEVRGEAMDVRDLRRIPQAKKLANRAADRLAQGESLIVYCTVPGWTTSEGRRAPAVVFWSSASWLL